MKKWITIFAALFAVVQVQGAYVYWNGLPDPGSSVYGSYTVNGKSVTAGLLGVYWIDDWAGPNVKPGSSDLVSWNKFWGYCLTPGYYIGTPSNPWEASVVEDSGVSGEVAWLAGLMYSETESGYLRDVATKQDHALVQLAIWKSLGASMFQSPLADLDADGRSEIVLSTGVYEYDPLQIPTYTVFRSVSGEQGQDLIGASMPPDSAVPEPSMLGIMGVGLASALLKKRKR